MPRKDTGGGPISAQAQQDLVSDGIENFELPKSLVTRIAKSAIPENAKLQKETVLSLVKGSTVFINYLGAAHDVAVSKQHKSISASDVLKALELIEFGDLVDKLQGELLLYRQHAKTDKTKKGPTTSVPSGKVRPPPGAATAPAGAKSKGKEKMVPGPLPPPFTSAPLASHGAGESVSSGVRAAMEVDWEEELGEAADAADTEGEAERGGYEDDVEADLEDAVDDADLVNADDEELDEDEADEGDIPEDPMEIEEDEPRKDAAGLEGMVEQPLNEGP
ncbi:histone-fold-containing protein [Lyophyllum atratum]|nr:histone-fold-containing protein [Lyophyllum atratum]